MSYISFHSRLWPTQAKKLSSIKSFASVRTSAFSPELFKAEKLQLRSILESFWKYKRGRRTISPKTLLLKILTNHKSHQFKGTTVLNSLERQPLPLKYHPAPTDFHLINSVFHGILMCSCTAVDCLSLAEIASGGATDIWYQGQFLEQGRLFFFPEELHFLPGTSWVCRLKKRHGSSADPGQQTNVTRTYTQVPRDSSLLGN